MLRVDDRMIHGQVAIAWTMQLQTRNLIVANDVAAASPVQSAALKMAGPPSCKISVMTVPDAIKTLLDPRAHDLNMMVICTTAREALRVAQGATSKEIERINFGNYGRLKPGALGTEGKKALSPHVYADAEDLQIIRDMLATGIPVDVQLVPNTDKKILTEKDLN